MDGQGDWQAGGARVQREGSTGSNGAPLAPAQTHFHSMRPGSPGGGAEEEGRLTGCCRFRVL